MLQRVGLAALAVVFGVSSFAYAQGALVVEGITEEGDIYGSYGCPTEEFGCQYGPTPFVFVVQCDGTYAYYSLDPGSPDGATPLGAVRDELGRLMVCGVSHHFGGPVGDLPIAWLLDGGEEILASQGDDFVRIDPNAGLPSGGGYAKGLFADVAVDEVNDRWILVGGGQIDDGTGPEGATTLVIPFASEVEPLVYTRYGPVNDPDVERLVTDCRYPRDPDFELVDGSTSIAWGIKRSAAEQQFYTAGSSDLENVLYEQVNHTHVLAFRDLLGPEDLEMPVQSRFLVQPGDWFCYDETGSTSVRRASAFDVLETGVVVGSLRTESSNSDISSGFWVNAGDEMVVNRFAAHHNSENAHVALGAALRSEGWVHAVGMERLGEPDAEVDANYNVFRLQAQSFASLPLARIFEDVDRAVEWRFENGSPSVFDLNDRTLLNESEHPGVVLLSASDVNGSGSITGMAYRDTATDDGAYFGYLLTAENVLTDLDQLRLDAPVSCFGDIKRDRQVDGGDIGMLLGEWDDTGECLAADLNGDGRVDGGDLGLLLGAWDANCSY
jgi:hypothetical protein